MILLSVLALFEQMVQGGYLAAIMTSIQTQFNMSTSKIGFIVSSFDIMGVFATPAVSYIGSRYNKCKIIAICGYFYVLGTAIYTFPYFFSPKYTVHVLNNPNTTTFSRDNQSDMFDSTVDMCKYRNVTVTAALSTTTSVISTITTTTTNALNYLTTTYDDGTGIACNRGSSVSWTYVMFILAQLFMSIGSAPLFSLGITYLTDNIEERKHASYTGIYILYISSFY